MVEPLPLVPATWITGGSLRSGWSERSEQTLHAIERQVDALGMQRVEPRDDRVNRRHQLRIWRAHACAGTGNCCCAPAAGDLVNSRHSSASVARSLWRCTTMSTMP